MRGIDYVVLGFTFFIGLVSGGYFYVTSFAPEFAVQDSVEEVSEVSFRIQGQEIGGCQDEGVCQSFVLKDNKTYKYIQAHGLDEATPEAVNSGIARGLFTTIKEDLLNADYVALEREDGCVAITDGSYYVYTIVVNGEEHELKTCNTEFGKSEIAKTLGLLWIVESDQQGRNQ